MSDKLQNRLRARRAFLKGAGGAAALAAGSGLVPGFLRKLLGPSEAHAATLAEARAAPPDLYYAGTDGWISLPPSPAISFHHPDPYAPDGLTTYIFGFRNVTGLSTQQRLNQKGKAQHNAPMFWTDEYDPAGDLTPYAQDFKVDLTNLGLGLRPDLVDSHTLHWHGFRNVIPLFDGEPTGSISVPVGRVFRYIYRPKDPGTYMFHCHVEDVEHVHMGMTGPVFVRARQNFHGVAGLASAPVARLGGNAAPGAPMGYAYNDGDGSTAYDREFAMFLSEVWAEAHWCDAHIQLPDWTDYRADFALLNGRVYPDTLAPNSPFADPSSDYYKAVSKHALPVAFDTASDGGDLVLPAAPYEHLQNQPLSALVTCTEGERVLLRFANLGFKPTAMTLTGIKMKVVGKDATPLRGRDGTDTSYETNTLSFGAGESIDAIFQAPAYVGPGAYDTYVLYNRAYTRSNNLAGGFGGQRTEVRVYPAAANLPQQTLPNT